MQLEVIVIYYSGIRETAVDLYTHVYFCFHSADCRRGQSLVVWAITEGRQAAREVDLALMKQTCLPVIGGVVIPAAMNGH